MTPILLLLACKQAPPSTADLPPSTSGDTAAVEPTGHTATTADTGTAPPWWYGDERYVWVDPVATIVRAGPYEWGFGSLLATGGDLDKDGRLEWTVGAPSYSTDAVVRSFEGTDLVAERHVLDPMYSPNYPTALAHADLNGDGFGDLVFSYHWGFHGRLQAITGTDPEDDAFFAIEVSGAEEGFSSGQPRSILAAADGSFLVAWRGYGTGVMRGRLPLELGPGSLADPVMLDRDAYEMITLPPSIEDMTSLPTITFPVVGHAVGDPTVRSIWLGVYYVTTKGNFGEIWSCPDLVGLALDVDCTLLDSGDLGAQQVAGDLDGDGTFEVMSLGGLPPRAQGTVHVYQQDGAVRATITGTRAAQLGLPMRVATDASGEAWLLVGQYNGMATEPAVVYAFRGSDVHGELTDEDAERVYVSAIGIQFPAFDVYRETPDSPPLLLLGHPADGAVYMVPFEPGLPAAPP